MQMPPPAGPQVVRRGTSKAVPVVVSAGLAVGVFCGLLFGLGLDDTSEASTASGSATETETAPAQPKGPDTSAAFKPDPPKPVAAAVGSGSAQPAAASSGSGSATVAAAGSGSAAGSAAATPATPAKVIGKLAIVIKPDAAAKLAKIKVDGKTIEGHELDLDLTGKLDAGKKEARQQVKVRVEASGYKSYEGKIDVVAVPDHDNTNTLEVELIKRPTVSRPPRPPSGHDSNHGGSHSKPKCPHPPCGLIDI